MLKGRFLSGGTGIEGSGSLAGRCNCENDLWDREFMSTNTMCTRASCDFSLCPRFLHGDWWNPHRCIVIGGSADFIHTKSVPMPESPSYPIWEFIDCIHFLSQVDHCINDQLTDSLQWAHSQLPQRPSNHNAINLHLRFGSRVQVKSVKSRIH